ncbi:MAG: alpha/beta fold hydrolase [Solirubrobacteraceae bacterium]
MTNPTAIAPESQLAHLERFRRSVQTPAGTVSVIDVGAGPAALLVHGVGTNAHLWRHVIAAVAGPERRCVAVDLPLHGRSPASAKQPFGIAAFAELLEALCAELDLAAVDLVANDTGGAIAQVFAATHPARIRTLALTNCETHDNVPPRAFRPTILLARAGILARTGPRLLRDPGRARRRVFGSGYEDVEALPLEVLRSFLEPVLATTERARQFERWLTSLHARDLLAVEPALRRLEAPTLVAWGTGDRFFDVRWARWLAETLPNVRGVVEIPRGRLFFPDERAPELVALLEGHWT